MRITRGHMILRVRFTYPISSTYSLEVIAKVKIGQPPPPPPSEQSEFAKHVANFRPLLGTGRLKHSRCVAPFSNSIVFAKVLRDQMLHRHSRTLLRWMESGRKRNLQTRVPLLRGHCSSANPPDLRGCRSFQSSGMRAFPRFASGAPASTAQPPSAAPPSPAARRRAAAGAGWTTRSRSDPTPFSRRVWRKRLERMLTITLTEKAKSGGNRLNHRRTEGGASRANPSILAVAGTPLIDGNLKP